MPDLLQTVDSFLVQKARLSAGDGLLVGFSGGADSVVLLHLLHALAEKRSWQLLAAHLDHCLRPGSEQDALFARRFCADRGVSFVGHREDVRQMARERGLGIEEAARKARRDFLERTAGERGCRFIVLGHHRRDQAETVLHRLLRGASLSGLAAMRPMSPPYLRPLLEVPPEALRHYLQVHRLPHVEDESNRDPAYTRNRIRHRLLPLLQEFNPACEEHFLRLSRRIALEEDFWREQERSALTALRRGAESGIELDREGILALHPALQLRVLRRAVEEVRGDLREIGAAHLDALARLVAGESPQGEAHLPGLWAARRYGRILIRASAPDPPVPYSFCLEGEGAVELPGGACLSIFLKSEAEGEDEGAVEFDPEQVPFPLEVRSFRPGDRFRPCGAGGGKKLKDWFIDHKVELEVRRRVPLVLGGGEVLWVGGMRRCEGRRPREGGAVLRMTLTPPKL